MAGEHTSRRGRGRPEYAAGGDRMTITKLPSGRWRSQVWSQGKWLPVADVIGGERSYRTKPEAAKAKRKAQERLDQGIHTRVTVAAWRERWISDPLFARPKESTNMHNAERTRLFAEMYGDLPISHVGDLIVATYLAGGKRNATVPALRAMFNDARGALAGRLITVNPFANLGLSRGHGNKERQPPTVEQMRAMLAIAREHTPPSFADYLEAGCLTAMRPSELDALAPGHIDFEAREIHVQTQWSAKVRKFTTPKYGPYTMALVEDAERLLAPIAVRGQTFMFETLRGTHYTPSSRTHHWNRVRSGAGLADLTLYLATRHYFGWYSVNVLGLDTAVVAEQLGHRDGGKLVEELYGHPDKRLRRDKIRAAYKGTGNVVPIRREESA